MVVWLVRCFFLLLALAVVVWLVDTVYNRTLPRQQMGAVVAQKSWTTFPRTIVWVRRDRKDCSVVFLLPDMGSNMTLSVPEDVFAALQKGEAGTLTYQGNRFQCFVRSDGSMVRHTSLARTSEEE